VFGGESARQRPLPAYACLQAYVVQRRRDTVLGGWQATVPPASTLLLGFLPTDGQVCRLLDEGLRGLRARMKIEKVEHGWAEDEPA